MMIDHYKKTIQAWWSKTPSPGNFGDILTPWIIKQLTGYDCIHTIPSDNSRNKVLLGIGSIIDKTNSSTVVWGSGCISKQTIPSLNASYLAVRGPISRDMIMSRGIYCPEIYGDPALILPKLYKPSIKKKYRLGIFTHYVDYDMVYDWYCTNPTVTIISPINRNITDVIDQMLECDAIVSSSLHGIIVSNAYGIPTTWVKFSDKLTGNGDDIKFHDYFLSVHVPQTFTKIYEKLPITDLEKLQYFTLPEYDLTKLMKVFPIPI